MAFSRIKIVDTTNEMIFEGRICFLPILEEVLNKRCWEYYNQEVCIVRKETMKKILYLEMENRLLYEEGQEKQDTFLEIPDYVANMLSYRRKDLLYCIQK